MLALALASVLAPGETPGQAPRSTMPPSGRPRTPAEGRAADARIAMLSGQIANLADRNRVQRATLMGIARILGTKYPAASNGDLINLVAAKAAEAASLQQEVADLSRRVLALSASRERDEAARILIEAKSAFADGRLEDTDRALARLQILRSDQSVAGRLAWQEAIVSRSNLAALQLDADRAADILLQAKREEAEFSNAIQWELALAAAQTLIRQGELLGDNAALERAVMILEREALPLAPRESEPLDWAVTQGALGVALTHRAQREPGLQSLGRAMDALESALEVLTPENDPQNWAILQIALGSALGIASERDLDPARLQTGLTRLRMALTRGTDILSPVERAALHYNIAETLHFLAMAERSSTRLKGAIDEYKIAAKDVRVEDDVVHWSTVQNGLCNTLVLLGGWDRDTATLNEAVEVCKGAFTALEGRNLTYFQAALKLNWGNALLTLGRREAGTARLLEAEKVLQEAAELLPRAVDARPWARARIMMAHVSLVLFERTGNRALLDKARDYAKTATEAVTPGDRELGAYLRDVQEAIRKDIAAAAARH